MVTAQLSPYCGANGQARFGPAADRCGTLCSVPYETRVKSPTALGCRLEGDGELEITGVAGMEHAGPGHLTFLANPKYAPKVKHTRPAPSW